MYAPLRLYFFILFRIFLVPTLDQSFDSWLSNLPLISNFPCTHARSILRQLIFKSSSYFEFPLHPRSINPSTVDFQIFLLFRIFLAPTIDQSFDSWLSNLPVISNFPCTNQLIVPIHPWSTINQPSPLLSKFFLVIHHILILHIFSSGKGERNIPGLVVGTFNIYTVLTRNYSTTPGYGTIFYLSVGE